LIPVKAFSLAKGRLAGAVSPAAREQLAKEMATRLVQAQHNAIVAICCDEPAVAEWATSVGACTIWCPGTDLNGAVQQGFSEAARSGYTSVAIAHGDLPLATSLHVWMHWPGVTLIPDRHRTGSNVIVLPTSIDFTFSYGTNSLARHISEAAHHGRGLRIVHDANLSWDVDHPADLELPQAQFLNDIIERATQGKPS
jgi:2-phospho-L-lactate guanylyltransferase